MVEKQGLKDSKMKRIKPEDIFKLDALNAHQVLRMLSILYGERVVDDVVYELLYNDGEYADRTVIFPRW